MRFADSLCLAAVSTSCLLALSTPVRADNGWKPFTPQELAMKRGQVDAEAGAEALEWEITVSDERTGNSLRSAQHHHLRVKVFNERGREALSRIDIPYFRGTDIVDISARTIRPNGLVVEVKKDAILERVIVKRGGREKKAKSFAVPSLEPGCIVEYQWTAVDYDRGFVPIDLQQEFPVEQIRFSIHPWLDPDSPFQMRIHAFNFNLPAFSDDPDGYHTMFLHGISASQDEPYMPPRWSVRPWVAIFYARDDEPTADQFWKRYGRDLYTSVHGWSRASGDAKKLAASLVAGVQDPDLKLERILEYCRTKLRNTDWSDSGLSNSEREWLRSDHSASDFLKRGMADDLGVLKVFLSLASAAGFDARAAYLPDRSETPFDPKRATWYLLTRRCAAVQLQGAWKAVDPSHPELPEGMLPWEISGVDMLVPDPETPTFVRTPIAPPEQSLLRSVAHLKLNEDGTVEGEVEQEYTGQRAGAERASGHERSPVENEKQLREGLQERLPGAEVSAVRFETAFDLAQPFRVLYHVRVPGYAQRVGSRLIVQPAFFRKGLGPALQAPPRKSPVTFSYPWSEQETVFFEVPPHFHLEDAPEIAPIRSPAIGFQTLTVRLSEDGGTFQALRTAIFGEGGKIWFPLDQYEKLKQVFDRFHEQDETLLSFVSDASGSH